MPTGIKLLKSGRYQARYFAGYDAKGKRQYPSKTFRIQSDAVKWRNGRLHEKDTGQKVSGTTLTLGEYLVDWLKIKAQEVRPNTLAMYERNAETYIVPKLGNIKLASLEQMHIQRFQIALLEWLSPKTVISVKGMLKTALTHAITLGLIRGNPVEGIKGPRKGKRKMYALSLEEARAVLHACETSKYGLFYKVALKTGIRPEEGQGLQWSALELGKRGILHVTKAIQPVKGGGWRWEEPKSKSGVRSIVFPASLVSELQEHRRKQLELRMAAGQRWRNMDLVFTTSKGTPLNRADLTIEFKKVLGLAGLPKTVRLYDLRHSFVTLSLLANIDIKTVSQEAGHSNVAFTLDNYAHVLKVMSETASDKRERLIGGAVKRHARGNEKG